MGMALLMVSMIAFGLISNESDLQTESRFSEPSYEPMSCSSSTAHDDDTNFYVDGTSGDDTYPGTSACPTKTIHTCKNKLRARSKQDRGLLAKPECFCTCA